MALYPHSTLLNLYGSTEVAGDVSYYSIDRKNASSFCFFQGVVSIGYPIHNCEIKVCNELKLKQSDVCELNDGEEGELVVLGLPLSQGYHGVASAGKHAFFNAFSPRRLVYCSGDRAVRREGLLYYLGRTDNLVKRNGIRLSIEEIEFNIAQILQVRPLDLAVVFASPMLVLFIVKQDANMSTEAVRDKLRGKLPSQQLPNSIRLIEKMPRTASGKCDRLALVNSLAGPKRKRPTGEYHPVETLVMQQLGVDSLNTQRTLEQNGCDSGALIQLRWKLERLAGRAVELTVLQTSSIAELCLLFGDLSGSKLEDTLPQPLHSILPKRKRPGTTDGKSRVCWEVELLRCVDSDPCFVESSNTIYIGSHGGDVLAIDCETGQTLWTKVLDSRVEGAIAHSNSENLLFVPTYYAVDIENQGTVGASSNRGKLVALSAASGAVQWEFGCVGEIKAGVLVVGDAVVFGAYDKTLYAVTKSAGLKRAIVRLQGNVRSKPVAVSKELVCIATTKGTLEFVSMSSWQVVVVYRVPNDAPVFAAPAFDEKRSLIVFGAVSGLVQNVSIKELPAAPEEVWSFECGKALFTTPVIYDNCVIFGGHDNVLRAVNIVNGELLWQCHMGGVIYANPFMLDTETVVVATTKGEVSSIKVKSGKVHVTVELPGEVYSAGCSVSSSTSVVIGSRDNYVRKIRMI